MLTQEKLSLYCQEAWGKTNQAVEDYPIPPRRWLNYFNLYLGRYIDVELKKYKIELLKQMEALIRSHVPE